MNTSHPTQQSTSLSLPTVASTWLLDPVIVAEPTPTIAARNIVMLENGHGETGPVAFCYSCGQRIKDAGLAGVLWTYSKRKYSGYRILCKFTPNGALGCLSDPAYRRQPWMELTAFYGFLLHNTGITTRAQYDAIRGELDWRV